MLPHPCRISALNWYLNDTFNRLLQSLIRPAAQDGAEYNRNSGSHSDVLFAIKWVSGPRQCYEVLISGHQTLIWSLYVLVVLTKTLQAAKANLNPEYVSVPVRTKRCPFQVGRGLTYKGFSIDFCFWKFKHPAVAVAKSTLGKGNLCCWDYEKPSSPPPRPLYSSAYCARNKDICKCMG